MERALDHLAWSDLPELFPEFPQSDLWVPKLRLHAELLEAAEPRVRVTSVSPPEAVRRHYAESLEILRLMVAAEPSTLDGFVDIGSGGGFPGLVAAAVLPEAQVVLVEPLQKRARLLESLATRLGLVGVTVRAERAEEAGRGELRGGIAAVTARAVARIPVLLEYCAPILSVGGLLALPRGSSASDDVSEGADAAEVLGLRFDLLQPMRCEISDHGALAIYRKIERTPDRYPRRPGMPQKRPL